MLGLGIVISKIQEPPFSTLLPSLEASISTVTISANLSQSLSGCLYVRGTTGRTATPQATSEPAKATQLSATTLWPRTAPQLGAAGRQVPPAHKHPP